MTKCPKCNNNLSSSDVMCPKCGALVEELNVDASAMQPLVEEPSTDSLASDDTKDHYENIILYNESFPIIEPDTADKQTNYENTVDEHTTNDETIKVIESIEEPTVTEKFEDFDIDDIFASEGITKHVNPLLAHLEKMRNNENNPETDISDENSDEDSDASSKNDVEEIESEEDIETEYVEPFDDSAIPIAISELEKIAKEILNGQPPKEEQDDFPIKDMPSYSKTYLDAIRNIDAIDETSDAEEDFDPDAYMENYRAKRSKKTDQTDSKTLAPKTEEKSDGTVEEAYDNIAEETADDIFKETSDDIAEETSNASAKEVYDSIAKETNDNIVKEAYDYIAEETTDDAVKEVYDSIAEETDDDTVKEVSDYAAEETTDDVVIPTEKEEPVRRRYNPNKRKHKDEPIVHPESKKAHEEELASQEESEKAHEEESPVPEEAEKKKKKPPKSKKKKKTKKKKTEEVLDLELEPERFFNPELSQSEVDNEHFVFDNEEPIVKSADTQKNDVEYFYDSVGNNQQSDSRTERIESPLVANMPKSNQKRLPLWATILIWVVVLGGVFFGAYSFNKYVNQNYDSYNSYIYEITNGKIDIDSIFN